MAANGSSAGADAAAKGYLENNKDNILKVLKSINQPQALEENKANLLKCIKDITGKDSGVVGLVDVLGTNSEKGIASTTASARRECFGPNELPSSPRKDLWTLFVETFDDATLQILIVAAVVSLAVGIYDDPSTGYVEGVAILIAVLIVSVVTALNDYQKESQFRELSDTNDAIDVVVVRDGFHWQIPIEDVVVGDVVCVEAGDKIPCDGVVLAHDLLSVDESALTGEPIDIDKDTVDDPFMLSGCTVISGSTTFLATAVGRHSQWGIIKSHLEKEQDQTPLQEKLDEMAANIGYIGMGAAAATFVAMMVIFVFVKPDYLAGKSFLTHALDAFIIGVTIVVVAVPEGLPLAVTISLAFSTQKMLADQNLIRHLAACETMGNATNICSDKTGTLTENRMTVVKGIFADTRNDDVTHAKSSFKIGKKAQDYILDGIACCTTAKVVVHEASSRSSLASSRNLMAASSRSLMPEDNDDDRSAVHDERPKVIGNKTEAAMLIMAGSVWGSHDDWEKRRAAANIGKENGSRIFPFTSSRKRMSVLVVNQGSDESSLSSASRLTRSKSKPKESTWTLFHKGAAELLLKNCTTYLDSDGNQRTMSQLKRDQFLQTINEYANDALRCVALCHRDRIEEICQPETATIKDLEDIVEKQLCLDALFGIADPLRHDVVEAVATCQHAGIIVRMVTGDNLDTAVAIAKQAGILTKGGLAMRGEDFRKLSPAQLDEILPSLQVLARSSPEDKHILVQRLNGGLMPKTKEEWLERHPGRDYETERDLLLPGYKEEWDASRGGVGEVVGVTGDGTNDGPALKAADVGLSMGLSGTDVAKQASDIIIMDDNFASIVKAVLWGRSVFDNIRKFLQFQLTVNVVALTITFLAAVSGYNPPLNAVMMLWVNLIMDTMGALALGTEPPDVELLTRRPYKRDASLISRPMWRNILVQATYQLALLVFLLNRPDLFDCEDGSTQHFTILFNAFVFCQVFNEFNAREIGDNADITRSLSQSPMFLAVIVFTVMAQWLIVEFGGDFTQTTPLTFNEWRITVGFGAISLPVGYLMRMIPVSEDPASFAGSDLYDSGAKGKSSSLRMLVITLIPVLCAIVYQLYKEVEELKH